MIVQKLVIHLYSAFITNYCQLQDREYQAHVIIIIIIVSVQATWVSKCTQENDRGGYQNPFSIEAFEDTEAHWWLFEVERGGKAVQF